MARFTEKRSLREASCWNFEVENGAEAVLELRCVGAFDGPVAGVVDARGHLVGNERVALDEELDGENANIVERFEQRTQVRFGATDLPGR